MRVRRCEGRYTGLARSPGLGRLGAAARRGLGFAVPTVALALLAHLPTARSTGPAAGRVLLVLLMLAVLRAAADLLRPRAVRPRAVRPQGVRLQGLDGTWWSARASTGRPALGAVGSVAGLLAVQVMLHAAFTARPTRAPAGQLAGLLCGAERAAAAGGAPWFDASQLRATALAGRPPGSLIATTSTTAAAGAARLGPAHLGALHLHSLGPAVLLAHSLAAAVVFWWARHGVRAVAAACRILGSRLPTLRAAHAPTLTRRRVVRAPALRGPRVLERPWAAVASRGPPVAGFTALTAARPCPR
ncbi:hypothetical protein [Parafrankia sp. EUN1f]|uniref:hypothetical protein n=1 Tax=Parafrankia sp. EUN1f TaxID=102897 RepID=UPI0006817550|nr:hypothetical protein [Parafrankia sp. EUN1f]